MMLLWSWTVIVSIWILKKNFKICLIGHSDCGLWPPNSRSPKAQMAFQHYCLRLLQRNRPQHGVPLSSSLTWLQTSSSYLSCAEMLGQKHLVSLLKADINPLWDPFQFAYRQNTLMMLWISSPTWSSSIWKTVQPLQVYSLLILAQLLILYSLTFWFRQWHSRECTSKKAQSVQCQSETYESVL